MTNKCNDQLYNNDCKCEHEHDDKLNHHDCQCESNNDCCQHLQNDEDVEVIELEDENGDVEDFVILEELDFENRHFVVVAPLSEVEAQSANINNCDTSIEDLTIEILEANGDEFATLDDDDLTQRLLIHLDNLSKKLEEDL